MTSINKGHLAGIVAFIVGVSIGVVITRCDTQKPISYPISHDPKICSYHIIYSPQYERNWTFLDKGSTTVYINNKDDADKIQQGLFDYIYENVKVVPK